MDPQFSPPLSKSHSGLVLEQPSQRALTRTDLAAQLGQSSDTRKVLLDQPGHFQ